MGNTKKGQTVKFNIINLAKSDSLYNYGMRILSFSNKLKAKDEIGWHRTGFNINYLANQFRREQINRIIRTFYTFTFTCTFEFDDD